MENILNNPSLLQRMLDEENAVLDFIRNNNFASHRILKKTFSDNIFVFDDITQIIDNLLYERKIKTVYPKDSMVAIYVVC